MEKGYNNQFEKAFDGWMDKLGEQEMISKKRNEKVLKENRSSYKDDNYCL